MINEWKTQLTAWKSLPSYKIGLFLSFERLLNQDTGPAELQHLATFLQSVGYETVEEKDIACVWYTRMGKGRLSHHHEHGYEYKDYVPGFTKEQQELLLEELQQFKTENEDDTELVEILQGYEVDIRDHMYIV
jgi:hypothetical protein